MTTKALNVCCVELLVAVRVESTSTRPGSAGNHLIFSFNTHCSFDVQATTLIQNSLWHYTMCMSVFYHQVLHFTKVKVLNHLREFRWFSQPKVTKTHIYWWWVMPFAPLELTLKLFLCGFDVGVSCNCLAGLVGLNIH